ncbi:MAG: hypothetical protein AAF517_21245 [Planctomycetota bacterium]
MLDRSDFYPVLNRSDWQAADKVFTRNVHKGNAGPHGLLVSYGVVSESENEYLTKAGVRIDAIDPAEMHRKAIQNLVKRPDRPKWDVWKNEDGRPCLVRGGDELVCADLLYPKMLAQACAKFKGKTVYLGVPDRFSMILDTDPDELSVRVAQMYEGLVRDNGPALTPVVFELSAEGKIVADLPVAEISDEASESDDDESAEYIELCPYAAFYLVAGADGELDDKEIEAFFKDLAKKIESVSPEIQVALGMSLANLDDALPRMSKRDPVEVLRNAGSVMRNEFAPEIAREYAGVIYDVAKAVANASGGGGLFSRRSAISEEEQMALDMIQSLLRVE